MGGTPDEQLSYFDLLKVGSSVLTIHQQSMLAQVMLERVVAHRKNFRATADSWACNRCDFTHQVKQVVVEHLTGVHRTKKENAAWMPIPLVKGEA